LSRWISADPAMVKYLPEPGDFDSDHDYYWALKNDKNGKLPGMGGVYNPVNLNLYHYAGDNPVKLVDPDGNFIHLIRRVLYSPTAQRAVRWASRTKAGRFIGRQGDKLYNALARGGSWAIQRASNLKLYIQSFGGRLNPKIYEQLEKQFEKDGAQSIQKAYKSAFKTLKVHLNKLKDIKYKSAVEKTIQNVKNQIKTLNKFMKDYKIKKPKID
jgi:hypothetical protein